MENIDGMGEKRVGDEEKFDGYFSCSRMDDCTISHTRDILHQGLCHLSIAKKCNIYKEFIASIIDAYGRNKSHWDIDYKKALLDKNGKNEG